MRFTTPRALKIAVMCDLVLFSDRSSARLIFACWTVRGTIGATPRPAAQSKTLADLTRRTNGFVSRSTINVQHQWRYVDFARQHQT